VEQLSCSWSSLIWKLCIFFQRYIFERRVCNFESSSLVWHHSQHNRWNSLWMVPYMQEQRVQCVLSELWLGANWTHKCSNNPRRRLLPLRRRRKRRSTLVYLTINQLCVLTLINLQIRNHSKPNWLAFLCCNFQIF